MTKRKQHLLSLLFIVILIPLVIGFGVVLLKDRKYNIISLLIIFLSFVPLFLNYERKEANTRIMVLIAVLTAISTVGRVVFYGLPFFKPVAAIVIISGIYLGSEVGFLVGALSAVISNMMFGQGPWTPFQMFAWGLIGFLTGLPLISQKCQESKWFSCLIGIVAGLMFSLIMDIWSGLSFQDFSLLRYQALIIKALPVTLIYMVSNVVFLLVLQHPIGDILERIKIKYGL